MGHERILTVKDSNGTNYAVDKWGDTGISPATRQWKFPARIKDLSEGRRLDRWETADKPRDAFAQMDDLLEVAIEGLERLLIDHHVDAAVITVTRNASFNVEALEQAIDVDAEIVDSSKQSIRT